MNLRKAIPLVAALIFGLISARLVIQMIHSKNNAQVVQGPQLAKIVMAAKDLPAGEQIQEDDLRIGQVVADSAPQNAFTDVDVLAGRVLQSPVVSGQPIVEAVLAEKGSGAGLQAVIPPGMRAITVVVDEVSGVAGNVTPGCHVDLMQTVRGATPTENVGRCILQNIVVSAVGMRTQHGLDETAGTSVTLLVTPHQAAVVELATSQGKPRMVLRGSRDHQTAPIAAATISELKGDDDSAIKAPAQPALAASDPFAGAATRPAAVANVWQMRVISGGQANLVDVKLPGSVDGSATAGTANETKPVTGQ